MYRHGPKIGIGFLFFLAYVGFHLYEAYEYDERHEHKDTHYKYETREHENASSEPRRESENQELVSHPDAVNPELIIDGLPKPSRTAGRYVVLPNIGYVSGYDSGLQDPLWVETRFSDPGNAQSAARPGSFSPDDRINSRDRITTQEYSRTGYDRGHMAPNEGVSLCFGRAAQIESFLLTNVVPQTPNLNRGIWETLEKIILNDYSKRFGHVWIIDGPVFDTSPPQKLNNGRIAIPTRCYKIVIRQDADGSLKTLAFEIPQDLPSQQHDQRLLPQYLTSINQIEQDTGITFFPDLDSDTATQVKSETATRLW